MKAIKVSRPNLYWANYSYQDHGYTMVELRLYKETTSEYKGVKYYHHRHLLSIKYQANAGKLLSAYALHFEYEAQYNVGEAHRIVGKLIRQPGYSLKQILRTLKKMKIPKYIYAQENGNNNFLPYQWRNKEQLYFQLLA